MCPPPRKELTRCLSWCAQALAKAGVKYVAEGANMPSEADAIKVYHDSKIMFGPAKVRTTTNSNNSGPTRSQFPSSSPCSQWVRVAKP